MTKTPEIHGFPVLFIANIFHLGVLRLNDVELEFLTVEKSENHGFSVIFATKKP